MVWGHPHENPGRRPKNRAGVVVASCVVAIASVGRLMEECQL